MDRSWCGASFLSQHFRKKPNRRTVCVPVHACALCCDSRFDLDSPSQTRPLQRIRPSQEPKKGTGGTRLCGGTDMNNVGIPTPGSTDRGPTGAVGLADVRACCAEAAASAHKSNATPQSEQRLVSGGHGLSLSQSRSRSERPDTQSRGRLTFFFHQCFFFSVFCFALLGVQSEIRSPRLSSFNHPPWRLPGPQSLAFTPQ